MIEMIATTVEDAMEIEAGGADRIELVSALSEGGLTPSFGLIEAVIQAVDVPVNVMVRPHSKSFVYTDVQIELMKKDIICAKALGANGVVLGVLTEDNKVDTKKLACLLSVCDGLDVTFHRAIDETDVVSSVQQLTEYAKITTILTSGGLAAPIQENLEIVNEVVEQAKHIDILLGGGLTLGNIMAVAEKTKATSFHFGSAVSVNNDVDQAKVAQLVQLLETNQT